MVFQWWSYGCAGGVVAVVVVWLQVWCGVAMVVWQRWFGCYDCYDSSVVVVLWLWSWLGVSWMSVGGGVCDGLGVMQWL